MHIASHPATHHFARADRTISRSVWRQIRMGTVIALMALTVTIVGTRERVAFQVGDSQPTADSIAPDGWARGVPSEWFPNEIFGDLTAP